MTTSKPRAGRTRKLLPPAPRSAAQVETGTAQPIGPSVVDLTDAASPALIGKSVLFMGIDHEPGTAVITSRGLAMAEHLARSADQVTVLSAVAHRPSWHRIARRALARRERGAAVPAGRPQVVRLDYTVGPDQTVVTRAVFEAGHLARAALEAVPGPPDLVFAATPGLGAVVAAARVARRYDVPLVVVVHDLVGDLDSPGGVAALERHALATADQVIVTSVSFRQRLLEHGLDGTRIHLVPAWADLERCALSRRDARLALGWPTRGQTVVLAGAPGGRVDLATALAAARGLQARHRLHLMVMDDGGHRRVLLDEAAGLPAVRLMPPPAAGTLPVALAAADVVMVCERADAGEAMTSAQVAAGLAAGRPVVAAVRPGGAAQSELDRSQGAGLAVPAGDGAALAAAIGELLDDRPRRMVMAEQALAHAGAQLAHHGAMKALDRVVMQALWPWLPRPKSDTPVT